jgi:glycosyltransferase involved in cell wall biosynthesis
LNTALRVLILTPTALPNLTGNAISAERWRLSLSQKGIVVNVIETQNLNAGGLVDVLDRFRPHVVHAHHINRAGALMLDPLVAEKYGQLPFVVSPGGTDINLHVMKGAGRKIVGKICRRAHSIIAQSPEIACLLQELLPDLKGRIAAVPKSFLWFGKDDFDLRAIAGCRQEEILFFMPAGIRPVKGNLECLCAMEKAHAASPKIRVVFAGPALDAGYAARFEKEIKRLDSFAKWILQVPVKAMHAACEGADVILNHSHSEGLSNSLLEAMAAGRPILASDIPGNRWVIRNEKDIGPCGRLFEPGDGVDFVGKVLQLAIDPAFRESLAANGRLRAAAWPSPSDEAQALLEVYEAAIRGAC